MTATHQTPPSVSTVSDVPRHDVSYAPNQRLVERARQLGPVIREHAGAAERDRRVPKPVLDALSAAGLHRMLTPRSLDGLEVDPVTCARVVEEVASFDSAAGWALQANNINVWWASRLPDEGVQEIYGADPGTLMAAAFHPPQQATEVPNGYRVTGRAPLASSIHDCEWVLFSAIIMDDGQPRMTEHGPAMIAVVLRTADVAILDTWYTLGMRGTDSNDVSFDGVFVPSHRTFPLAPEFEPGQHFQSPLYRYPAGAIIGLFTAAVMLATARNAIVELREIAQHKTPFGSMKTLRDRGTVQAALAASEAMLRSARTLLYDTLGEAWGRTLDGQPHTLEHRADLLLACIHAVTTSAKVTDRMHALGGTTGIYTRNRLERLFRDAHTLRQHGFTSESKLEAVGQVYLGLPPDFPLIAF